MVGIEQSGLPALALPYNIKQVEGGAMPKECNVDNCHRPVKSCGLCAMHYARLRHNGDVNIVKRVHNMPERKMYPSEYGIWLSMKRRCDLPTAKCYSNYGGRGIKVCDRWLGPFGFMNFLKDMGARPDGMSLDRIDVDNGYSPGNCRWANLNIQASNTRRAKQRSSYIGVRKDPRRNAGKIWEASISVNKKRYRKVFSTEEEASEWRKSMERTLLGYEVEDIV